MPEEQHYTWAGQVIHESESEPHVAALRFNRQSGALTVAIGNTDLPAFVSDGVLYIQAPLPHVFEAFAESVSDFVGDLEIRVSDQRGRALSLDRDGRPVSSATMAKSRVVRGRRQR